MYFIRVGYPLSERRDRSIPSAFCLERALEPGVEIEALLSTALSFPLPSPCFCVSRRESLLIPRRSPPSLMCAAAMVFGVKRDHDAMRSCLKFPGNPIRQRERNEIRDEGNEGHLREVTTNRQNLDACVAEIELSLEGRNVFFTLFHTFDDSILVREERIQIGLGSWS